MLVELGGGTMPHPRADVVVDMHHPRMAPAQDAADTPWAVDPVGGRPIGGRLHDNGYSITLADGVVDEVYSSHFLEHVPHGDALLAVMNEAHRVLRSGGTFTAVLPTVGHTLDGESRPYHGWQPWADPTHVSWWWVPEAFLYFCDGPFRPHADYGIKVWGQLGEWVPPEVADLELSWQRMSPAPRQLSTFWTIRDGWEAVVRLVKP